MTDDIFERHWRGYTVSTDPARLDLDAIHDFLANRSYWAKGRPKERVARALANSLAFGLYDGGRQAGLARIVTDYATFAWLCDVFVLEAFRGQGLGKWMVETALSHPDLATVRFMLATHDAHELYRRFGFEAPDPAYYMVRQVGAGSTGTTDQG